MNNKKVESKCEECGNEFLFDTLDVIEKENVKIENDTFTIIYYKCPECGAIQLVGMLNYRAKRIRDTYFAAYNSVKKMEANGQSKSKPFIYKQRLEKLEKLKKDLQKILHTEEDSVCIYKADNLAYLKKEQIGLINDNSYII